MCPVRFVTYVSGRSTFGLRVARATRFRQGLSADTALTESHISNIKQPFGVVARLDRAIQYPRDGCV
jgi:hypothetical protein